MTFFEEELFCKKKNCLKLRGKQKLQLKNEALGATKNGFGLVLSGFNMGATRRHRAVMNQLTLHIENLAQKECGRCLGVLGGRIRFVFPAKVYAVKFIQAVHADFPSVNLQADDDWIRVDVQELFAA